MKIKNFLGIIIGITTFAFMIYFYGLKLPSLIFLLMFADNLSKSK